MVTPVKSNQQHIFLHDALCEGPIEGLVYGDASVYLNGNRMKDIDSDAPFAPLNGKVSCSSSTFTTQGSTIPVQYSGTPKNTNYLIVRKGSIEKTGTPTYNSTNRQFTISTSSSMPESYTTGTDENKLIALVDKDTNGILMLGQGNRTTATSITFTPLTTLVPYEVVTVINGAYYLQLMESLEIATINASSNQITTSSAPTLGNTSGTDYYTFTISGSIQPDPEDSEADNPAKIASAKVQFKNGSTFQDPIIELNGVGGGTPYTGNPSNITTGGANLKQLDVASYNLTADEWEEIYPNFTPYSTSYYPEGESISSEGATEPSIITSTAFGLSGTTVKTVDELRIQIAYNAFYAIDKNDGKEYNNNAAYLFQIRLKRPGEATFEEKWRNAFNDGSGSGSVGQVYHSGKHKSAISFEHFIDLTPFKPFDDFEVRVTRLTRHKGRAIDTNRSDAQEGREQGDATSSISVLTAINKDKFSYPYTAHAGVFLDSREFSSVPKRSYEIRGLRVRVPKGYIPREYSNTTETVDGSAYSVPIYPEFWSGEMSDSLFYTDNPAWIFYDIIVNDRFGAGEWVKESDVDLYSLYRVAKYCDELVEDGRGGYEPRFRANLLLTKATDVYKVLKDMATIFTSLVYWMDGKMTTILDAPGEPVYQFTKSNVIDGMFSYETTGQKTRVNQVVVTWNDPALNYEQSALVVEDRAGIIEAGRIVKEEAFAFGCTSEGQARRYGKWKLWTAKAQTELINFSTSFEGLFVKPGDIIQVQDSDRYGSKLSGRIKSVTEVTDENDVATGTEIEFDREVTLVAGQTYELALLITESAAYSLESENFTVTNDINGENGGTYSQGDVITHAWVGDKPGDSNIGRSHSRLDTAEKASNAYNEAGSSGNLLTLDWKENVYVKTVAIDETSGSYTTLTTQEPLSVNPNVGSVWMLTETVSSTPTVGSPDLYKILNISQEQKNIYSVTAVEWDLDKYDYVDDPDAVIDIDDDVYGTEPELVPAPTQIRILQNSTGTKPNEELAIEWDYPTVVTVGNDELEANRYLDSFEILTNIPDNDELISTNNRARRYAFNEVPDGTYTFRVRAVSVRGNKSSWVTARYKVDDPFNDNVNRNKGLQLEGLATQFPFVTNETSSTGGLFRGEFDGTKGEYSYGNQDGYRQGDFVTNTSGEYKYFGEDSTATNITTWEDYRGGILKFRFEGSSPIIAPSRFRRGDAVALDQRYTLDSNIIRSEEWTGTTEGTARVAFVVLDNSATSLKLINARFDESLNIFYWYDLAEAHDEDNTTELDKYWTALSGTVSVSAGSNKVVGNGTTFTSLNNLNKLRLSSTFGARVSYIEDDTTMYLDRKVDTAISSGTTVYVQKYAPDFRKDVIIGRISVGNSGRGSFTFQNFLTLDPNLTGKRDVVIDSNVAFLQYDADENLVLEPNKITVTAAAIGFDEPEFKLTYGDPSTAPLDPDTNQPTIFAAADTDFVDPNKGLYEYEIDVWDGAETIPYDGGASITVYVEVREAEDPGNSAKSVTDSITLAKVGDVAIGSGNRTVFMELEDYSIVYNSGGAQPIYTGNPNYGTNPNATGDITFTATASTGFTAPIFRWKVNGTAIVPDPTNYPNATWYEASGGGDIATYDWPVPGTLGTSLTGFNWSNENGGSKSVVVEVAEKPDGWTATVPGSGTNTNEVTDDDIYAKDVDNILAVRVNGGGLGINFTNDSHVIPCDASGNVTSSSNSGGRLEVFLGGIGVDYVAGTPGPGEFTIGNISTTEDAVGGVGITVGSITVGTQTNGPDVAVIADHTFNGTLDTSSSTGFEATEAITYPITVKPFDGADAITATVTQTFTFVKDGSPAGTGLVFLYASSITSSGLTSITSSFPDVKVVLATGLVDHTDSGTVFQDGESGWYTSPNSAAATAQTTNEVLWVVAATANGTGIYDYIEWDEWSTPVQFTGTDGFNSATLELFASSSAEDGSGNPTAPSLDMADITYTFEDGSTSGSLGSWSKSVPSPSRSLPYVWRTSAAAISNVATADIDGFDSGGNTDGEDWSTPVLINRFVEDGITLELDNDAETVGAETETTALSNLSISTTAKVFQAGNDISDQWDFTANSTAAASIGITVNGTGSGSNSNEFTVTALSSSFTSGNVQITATAKSTGTYAGAASRTVNFTITKVVNGANGVSYRITPSVGVISYNPNTSSYSGGSGSSNNQVTFTANKIEDGSSSSQTGYWTQSGGSATISNDGTESSITVTASGTNDITVSFYLSSGPSDLVDTESVPVVSSGTNSTVAGDAGERGQKVITGYLYYYLAQATAPTVPSTSILSVTWSSGAVSSSSSNWSLTPPTFNAGSTNTYWYFTFTAAESGTYDSSTDSYSGTSVTFNPTTGNNAVKGIGFQNLVTFTSLTSSGNTEIDGGRITTGTIDADRISLSSNDVTGFLGFTPYNSTNPDGFVDASGAADAAPVQGVNTSGSILGLNAFDQVTITPANITLTTAQVQDAGAVTGVSGTGLSVVNSQAVLDATQLSIATSQLSGDFVESVNGVTGAVTGVINSNTDITAGKIVLRSGTLDFTTGTPTQNNSIVLDTTSSSNSIRIYDGTTLRVKLGKL